MLKNQIRMVNIQAISAGKAEYIDAPYNVESGVVLVSRNFKTKAGQYETFTLFVESSRYSLNWDGMTLHVESDDLNEIKTFFSEDG